MTSPENPPRRRRWLRRMVQGLIVAVVAFAGISIWSHFHYQPPPPVPPEAFGDRHAPEELRADLDYFVRTAEQIHPDLYHFISKDDVTALKRELQKQIDRPLTRKEFFPIAARLAASIGDGHTVVFIPSEEIEDAIESGAPWFPFDVGDLNEDGLTVKAVYAEKCPIAVNDTIVSVHGHDARSLYNEFYQWHSGEKEFYRKGRTLRTFRWNLWVKEIGSPFEIEWKSAKSGEISKCVVAGVTFDRIREANRSREEADANYTFTRLEGDIGYLDFRRMQESKDLRFATFLQETFSDIRQRPISGLIIDLRRNPGGSTSLGHRLLSYVTDKPYRMIARMEIKASPWKKRQMKSFFLPPWAMWIPVQYLVAQGRAIWLARDGEIVRFPVSLTQPGDNPLRYRGPVCVLIGEKTFSSAQKLTNAIKDYRLATLIGTETGGNPNAFGEMCIVRMPNSRLEFGVSGKSYIRANGDATWRRGILPDIEVRQTPEDRAQGIDTVLEFAKEWVRRQNGRSPSPDGS